MKKFIAIMLAVVMFGTFIAGCGSTATGTDTQPAAAPAAATEPSTQPQKIKIVTTIFPEYDWVREVLGDKAGNADLCLCQDRDEGNFCPILLGFWLLKFLKKSAFFAKLL